MWSNGWILALGDNSCLDFNTPLGLSVHIWSRMLSVSAHMRAEVEALGIVWVWLALPECEGFPAVISSAPHEVFQQPASLSRHLALCLFTFVHASVDPILPEAFLPAPSLMGVCIICMYVFLLCTFVNTYAWLGVRICICVRLCMHTVGSRSCIWSKSRICMWKTGFHVRNTPIALSPYSLSQDHPTVTPELADMSGLFSHPALEISNLCLPGLRYHIHGVFTSIAGDLSSGPHAYTENALTTRPSPKLQWRPLMQTVIHLSSLVLSVTVAFITVISLLVLLHDK